MQKVLRMFGKLTWLVIGFIGGYLARPQLEEKVNAMKQKLNGK